MYKLESNQYLPNGFGKPCSTYYYIVDDQGNCINLKTLKPYKGKQMNCYAIKNKTLAENFLKELNKN